MYLGSYSASRAVITVNELNGQPLSKRKKSTKEYKFTSPWCREEEQNRTVTSLGEKKWL